MVGRIGSLLWSVVLIVVGFSTVVMIKGKDISIVLAVVGIVLLVASIVEIVRMFVKR